MIKTCYQCKEPKPMTAFNRDKSKSDGLYTYCRYCHTARVRKYKMEFRDLIRERVTAKRLSDPEAWAIKDRARKYKNKYNLRLSEYEAALEMQGNRCAICKRHSSEFKKRLAIDHDHETEKIRGLLCDRCNRAIGLLGDSVETIESAAEYLRCHVQMESNWP